MSSPKEAPDKKQEGEREYMTTFNSIGMGENSLTVGVALATPKDLKNRALQADPQASGNNHHITPTFSMTLEYSVESTRREEHYERKTQAEKEKGENLPDGATDDPRAPDGALNPQVIAGLKNKISEANLYAGASGNPQLQLSILVGALGKTQSLIKDYLGSFGGSVIPADAATYIADLGRIHHQIIQSLSEVTAKNPQAPMSAKANRLLIGTDGSPFHL